MNLIPIQLTKGSAIETPSLITLQLPLSRNLMMIVNQEKILITMMRMMSLRKVKMQTSQITLVIWTFPIFNSNKIKVVPNRRLQTKMTSLTLMQLPPHNHLLRLNKSQNKIWIFSVFQTTHLKTLNQIFQPLIKGRLRMTMCLIQLNL